MYYRKDVPCLKRKYKKLKKILDIARGFTQEVTFLGITPVDESKTMPIPWRTDLYYMEKNVALYNDALEKFCAENAVAFIPIYDLITKDDLPDGLHPNPEGHAKIAEKVLERSIREEDSERLARNAITELGRTYGRKQN